MLKKPVIRKDQFKISILTFKLAMIREYRCSFFSQLLPPRLNKEAWIQLSNISVMHHKVIIFVVVIVAAQTWKKKKVNIKYFYFTFYKLGLRSFCLMAYQPTSVGHLMPRKVRLVLSSMQVLGHGFFLGFFWQFLILFGQIFMKRLIWSDFSERVGEVFWKTQCSQV